MLRTRVQEAAFSRLAIAGALCVTVAVGFAARWGPHATLNTPEGIWFGDPDACFHMRRVFLLLARGELPEFDAWSDFPQGCVPYVAPLLDWIVYALCRLGGLTEFDEASVGRVAAVVPAALGALTLVPVYGIARRLFGQGAGLGAAAALALLPGHVLYTRYGMVDHHVLESLFLATLAWLALGAPRRRAEDAGPSAEDAVPARGAWADSVRRADAPRIFAGAACLLGLTLSWNGFALYLIVFAGVSALAPWRSADASPARGPRYALWTLLAYLPLLAVVVLRGYWFRHGEVRYDAPSLFHLVVTCACAAWCAAAVEVHRRLARDPADPGPVSPPWLHGRPWRRVACVLAAGAVLAGACWALPGPVGEAFRAMFGFSGISVNRFNLEGRPIWTYTQWTFDHLSGISFLLPLAAFSLCAMAEDHDLDREGVWGLAGWALAFFILTVWMTRFTYAYAPFLAVVIGGVGWACGRAWGALAPGRVAGAPARAAVGLLVGFCCLLPALPTTETIARGQMEGGIERQRLLALLRAATRDPGDWRRPERRPAYAFLGPWGMGHGIKLWARRPTVSDNMGVGFEKEFRWLFETDAGRAYDLLCELGVGYVLVSHDQHLVQQYVELVHGPGQGPQFAGRDDHGNWQAKPAYWDRVAIRLVYEDGSGAGSASRGDGGLAHFRLVAEGPKPAAGQPASRADLKCFEVVAGARLTGTAAPGQRVTARVSVRVDGGRQFAFERWTRSDAAGRFELVVPYPTVGGNAPARAESAYRVTAGSERAAEIHVTEEQVREGGSVAVEFP